mmetsp:Transcript_40950/g.74966  ORF Transcript_40950/g.74966 Transcript_40950/m.74966 type:complete len:729 (-) Transcript_40950:3-2189(-)
MSASSTWASSHQHVSRLNKRALMEGVQGVPFCRSIISRSNNLYTHDCVPVSCCRRRRFSSITLARIQQPHWHHHNRHRQFSSLTPVGKPNILPCYSSSSRALGTTINAPILCSPNIVPMNSWQYSYRSYPGRMFATDANNSSNAKPTPTTSDLDDTDTPKEPKTTVPNQYMDAINSEVDEMEASSPAPLNDEQFTAKKTPDDFAGYLKGEEVMLEGDTGLMVKRQNFGQNEMSRNAKSLATSSSPPIRLSTAKKENILNPLSSASATPNANDTISDDVDNDNKADTKPPKEQSNSIHNYKFSSKDATLSDPQRHLDRSRAIKKEQQKQQAKSHAVTMKNVQRALGGNFIIAAAKLAAALSSGSSAMLSEFIHSVVDCGNQALLLVGLNYSEKAPDRSHPYGYGKAIYFWALVSALGTFFLGAGVSMTHAVGELMNPSMPTDVPKEVWGVLLMSFTVDGYVFSKTVQGVSASMRIDGYGVGNKKDMSFWRYASTKVRDPATLAVLLEDGAACLGVVIAMGGIGMAQYSGMPVFDGMAGVTISALLAVMGVALATVNHRFLIGQGIDKVTREDIEKIILGRRSIDNVYSVQSQWTGPDSFSYKAEVDFDGTFLAAKLLPRYQQEFFDAKHSLDRDLRVLLSWYAEDVMRTVEREVRHIEEEIRMQYPAAHYIELEPMSKDADRYAIDDGMEAQLRRVEIDVLNRYLKSMYKIKESQPAGAANDTSSPEKY